MNKFITFGHKTFLGRHFCNHLEDKNIQYEAIESIKDLPQFNFEGSIFLNLNLGSKGLGSHLDSPFTNLSEKFLEYQVLKYISDKKIKGVVNILPNCIYPGETEVPYEEEEIFNGVIESGVKYYANSKKMLTLACEALSKEYGIGTLGLVSTALYGPLDNFGSDAQVLPSLVKKFIQAKRNNAPSVSLWGSGRATREFLYVKDVPKIILQLIESFSFDHSEIINLSSGQEVPLVELAQTIKNQSNYDGEIYWDKEKPEGVLRKCLSNQRLKEKYKELNLTPLKEGVKETVGWYEKNY